MSAPKKILFIYTHLQTFVKKDIDLLSEFYTVKQLQFVLKKSFLSFFYYQIKGFLRLILQTPKQDILYIWFCDYHAFWAVFIAKVFRKKSVIVSGGFDAVSIPELHYGLFIKNNLRVKLARWAYYNCDKIIVVDRSLKEGNNTYCPLKNTTGILHFVPKIKDKFEVVPTGYSPQKWHIAKKKKQVMSVALIKNKRVFKLKGIDLFLEAAKQMPQTPFILVGLQDKALIPSHLQNLPNLTISPIVPQDTLISLYAESKVYCQFSLSEGLPNVLCEAMMSGCIPVGSNVNGIPVAIGDTGYILKKKNISQAVSLIKQALHDDDDEKGTFARDRILAQFSEKNRKNLLCQILNNL